MALEQLHVNILTRAVLHLAASVTDLKAAIQLIMVAEQHPTADETKIIHKHLDDYLGDVTERIRTIMSDLDQLK